MNTLLTILAVARREALKIAGDRWTVVGITIVPLVVSIILASIYAFKTVLDIPIVVMDRDDTAASRAVARALDAHESLRLVRISDAGENAEAVLRRGEATCVVFIPAGFESNLKRGERSPALCLLNGTNMVLSNYALKAVSTVLSTVTAGIAMERLEKTGTPAAHALDAYMPLVVTPQYLFNPGQNYTNFFLPGILAALLQQVVVIGAALTWVREFRSGEITELLGITRNVFALTAGKLLVYVLIGIGWGVFMFAGLFPLFGVPYSGSLATGALSVLLMIAAMALVAMAISSVFSHRETAMQVMFIVSSPAFLLSGYTFPQFAMTTTARWVGLIVPLTPFLTAWRRLVLYGGGFADVIPQLAMLLAGILVFGCISMVVLHRRLAAVEI
jgi:ABC-2 type transport system permease protein